MNKKNKTALFPCKHASYAEAYSVAEIEIDGMQVVFDERISLMPAQLLKTHKLPRKTRKGSSRN